MIRNRQIQTAPKKPATASRPRALRVGFVPLSDCAPLVMAHELGLYAKYGARVELSRELGWATIRDKIIYGELDAAHAVAGMPFAATLGIGSIRCECVTGLVLNLHGNAITLSQALWEQGVRDAVTLREYIRAIRGERTLTFGVVYPSSSHNFLLRQWLASGGIDPDRDVRIVVVPPPQMFVNLKTGNLDGYCVGEPWNSVAVQARAGWCVATSAQLAPLHPEKVLIARRTFAEQHHEEHVALIAALLDACAWCDRPENHEQMVAVLAQPQYVNASPAILRRSFGGRFDFGNGRAEQLSEFAVFHRHDANEPTTSRARWILQQMQRCGLLGSNAQVPATLCGQVFRYDLHEEARRLVHQNPVTSHEKTELLSR